jgi:hypothetical protein
MLIADVWRERWNGSVCSLQRDYRPEDVKGLYLSGEKDRVLGLVTWHVVADEAEIVSLDALVPARGFGPWLLAMAESNLKRNGIARAMVCTTNDNLAAHGLYLRNGYRLVGVHLNAACQLRERKPSLPERGRHGLVIKDLWEFAKELSGHGMKAAARAKLAEQDAGAVSRQPNAAVAGFGHVAQAT